MRHADPGAALRSLLAGVRSLESASDLAPALAEKG
jgi:hypothetical protein